ncbi:hypothetical protein MLD38_031877 [Melastoma candidum]|uniref:Uncharacterized protein n=1 Tax=Melastoma candidum TaxID=119954 RepID=A0ACB9MQE5_9MYRT|nr:hypothetical protein MLD38_031877 [Melastoma candidum]
MSAELDLLHSFIAPTSHSLTLHACAFLLFLAVLASAVVISPGGLAWWFRKMTYPPPPAELSADIPGPSGVPVIGQALDFTRSLPHRALAAMSVRTGSKKIMAFSVGFTRFVISSHPETAKEILNSSAFADRPVKESAYGLMFHRAMGFAPFGEYWRNLRRISATHLFSPRRIAAFGNVRSEIGLLMVNKINHMMQNDGSVEIKKILHFGSLNNVMATVFGKRYDFYGGPCLNDAEQLECMVSEGYELLGIFNWGDHFPLLGWLDLQGVRKRCKKLVERVNVFVGKIVEEHRAKMAVEFGGCRGEVNGDHDDDDGSGYFVDVLLGLEKESRLTDTDMVAVLWEMIFRGTDTVAILLEWILARMVLHPAIQSKVQAEIHAVVGDRPVGDSDLPRLPYLRAIVKETLRIHPPGPLLSWARLAVHDTSVDNHFVPAGTTAMVNMWSITHDESIWTNPEEFIPERFMGEDDVAIMGSDLRLAPFGSGRRVCPGKAMGLATVELWLAQLLQNFEWVEVTNLGVDLSERLRLSMEMKNPLVCKAIPRSAINI